MQSPSPLTVKWKASGCYCRQMRTGTFSEKKNFQDPEPGYRGCAAVTSAERRIFLHSCTMRIIFWARTEVKLCCAALLWLF